jgi:hypothetical protein
MALLPSWGWRAAALQTARNKVEPRKAFFGFSSLQMHGMEGRKGLFF